MKTKSTATRCLFAGFMLAGMGFSVSVRADVISDWNAIATPLVRTAPNVTATRQFALIHLAQFEAVNAVVGKYTPYVVNLAAPTASPEAAAAQAAHDLLALLYPTNKASLDTALATSLAAVPDGSAKSDGITLGAAVAAQFWTLRKSDGTTLTVSNYFPAGQGLWQPTPGGAASPVSQQYAYATPWALRCASQFRPSPPPALTSAQWTEDYNAIKSLGGTNSATRTQEQTDIGLFIIEFPFFLLNSALNQAIATHSFSLVDSARAFALMHTASADAGIAVWDAKYAYDFWRPVTAIQTADTNINPANAPDPVWLPLRTTPSHPEYPCAHCTISAAMCEVLAAIFGDNFTFTLESPSLPGKPRTFQKFSDYAALSLEGRLYAGFHYRNSSNVGLALGRSVGQYILNNFLVSGPTLSGELKNGEFRLTTRNVGTLQGRVETSSDCVTWLPLTNYTSTDLTLQIFDQEAANAPHKFYRAVTP